MQRNFATLTGENVEKMHTGKALWLLFKIGVLVTGIVLIVKRFPDVQQDVLNLQVLKNEESAFNQSDITATFAMQDHKIAYIRKNDSRIFLFDRSENVVTEVISFTTDKNLNGLVYYQDSFYVLSENGIIFKVTRKKEADPAVESFVLPVSTSGKRDALRVDTAGKRLLIDLGSDSTDDYSRGYFVFPVATSQAS